jgi:heptosyltransferase-1
VINFACRHFKGLRPCSFNKADGSECPTCNHVDEFRTRVLVIKLDSLGDVLRTGGLLPAIASRHDAPFVAWLTREEASELVGMIRGVDEVIALSPDGLARVGAGGWDHVYALSNDLTTASLATLAAPAHAPVGFSMRLGRLSPSNAAAARWLEMAAFDRLKRSNIDSYQRIMLDVIDHGGPVEPAVLEVREAHRRQARSRLADLFPRGGRRRVAVNIGAGDRWPKKMLDARAIARFVTLAQDPLNVDLALVGGAKEVAKADEILSLCGAGARVRAALTPDSLSEFVALLEQMDALLCGDTLAVHVASALGLPTVAVFGPTSLLEIPDFGGLIARVSVEGLDCLACYGDCEKPANCMSLMALEDLVEAVSRQLARARRKASE